MPNPHRAPVLHAMVAASLAAAALLGACGEDVTIPPTICPPHCAPEPELDGEWTQASQLWTGHREMGAAVIGSSLYVPGGISASRQTMSTMSVYDIEADRWSPGPSMPEPRHHHGVVAVGDRLYVIGGYSSLEPDWGPWPVAGEIFEYDPATGSWTERAPMPAPRAAAAVAAYDGRIYVFGGVANATEQAATYIYDPGTDSWTAGRSMPTAREHVAAVVLGSEIIVIAGRRFESGNLGAVEAYAPATDSWRALAPVTPASGHGAAVMSGRIYVMGGESLPAGTMTDRVWEYDPAADAWRRMASLPSARHGAPAVSLGDRIHVIGGHGSIAEHLVFRVP